MKSMTGFARRESENADTYVMVEIKSFNNRYLDIHTNIPGTLSGLEPKVREMIGQMTQRGKVECTIRYRSASGSDSIQFDDRAVRSLYNTLCTLREKTGIEEEVHISHLLRFEEQIRVDTSVDIDAAWKSVEPELQAALDELVAEREREGATVFDVVGEQLDVVWAILRLIEENAQVLDTTIRTQVREKFEEVVGSRVDEDRILSEIASLLVRFSIDEEIVRFRGHIEAFEETMKGDGPVGKKLDFLCQELNREVNTIGSKSPLYAINKQVVDAKDAIEKMREQLRNVE